MPKGDKLTAKQQAFLDAYIATASAPKAYRAAYKPARMTDRMCATEGGRLLNHPVIALAVKAHREALAQAEKEATEKAALDLGITRERHLREYARVAYGRFRRLASWNTGGEVTFKDSDELTDDDEAMISGIEKVVSPKGAESTKLKTYSRLAALDSISKMMGWFGSDGVPAGAPGNAPMNLTIHIEPPAKK